MYEDNRRFSWVNFFIKLIIVAIFVLFAMWLLSLSTKGLSNSLDVLTENMMVENVDRIKNVGKEYFTIERLPQETGETEKITLEEMYNKGLILEVKDQNGKACNASKSYVSVTKLDNEYQMKVYLECEDGTKQVTTIMGCYDLCGTDSCEVEKPSSSSKPVSKPSSKPSSSNKKTEYEYVLTTSGKWSEYGAWSNWSLTPVEASSSKEVATKTEQETYNYIQSVTVIKDVPFTKVCNTSAGYTLGSDGKCYKNTTDKLSVPTCPSTYTTGGYKYNLVNQNGLTCNYSRKNTTYTTSYVKTATANSMPSDTSNYHYEYVSTKDTLDCNNACEIVTQVTYKVYKKNYTTKTYEKTNNLSCPSGYTYSNNSCVKTNKVVENAINTCPGTNFKADGTGCYKEVLEDRVYTGYKTVTYYRYRTRTYIEGTTTYKWSTSKSDQSLLNAGYKLTGKTRSK